MSILRDFAEIGRLLHRKSPYEGFDASDHLTDLQGWNGTDPLFERVLKVLRPNLVIEVGSWKGQSTVNMAKIARDLALPTRIICVDTWLGSIEHWDQNRPDDIYSSLQKRNGYPQLYYTFLGNVVKEELCDYVLPFPQTSINAYEWFRRHKVQADFIYLDSTLEYEAVRMDAQCYWRLLSDGGVLVGDDYPREGVQRAAHDFASEVGRDLVVIGPKWLIAKEASLKDILK